METLIQKPPEPEPVPPIGSESTPPTIGPKNNTLAMASLGLGIADILVLCLALIPVIGPFCGCLGALLGIGALATGFMARNQIKTTGEGGDTMALIGIILGGIELVVIICSAIISVLVLLGPTVGNVFSSINSSLK